MSGRPAAASYLAFKTNKHGERNRVLDVRDCAHCGDVGSVLVTTADRAEARPGKRYCSRKCARRGSRNTEKRKAMASRRAMEELIANPTEAAALKIYNRGYGAGYDAGIRHGAAKERRRIFRLAKERERKEQAA